MQFILSYFKDIPVSVLTECRNLTLLDLRDNKLDKHYPHLTPMVKDGMELRMAGMKFYTSINLL
jgi:hypothetical protein